MPDHIHYKSPDYMSAKIKDIEETALKMSANDRARLAKSLIESLEGKVDEDVEQAWIKEIIKRKEDLEAGHESIIPAEKVLEKARDILTK